MSDRASHSKAPADHRRKWDTVEYEKAAKAREDVDKAINRDRSKDPKVDPVKRELLKIRDYKVDLDSKLGKSVVIQKNAPSGQQGGYYCNVCDCLVNDCTCLRVLEAVRVTSEDPRIDSLAGIDVHKLARV